MNRNGNHFVGFWKFPEGSYERINAWFLTHDDNFKALLALPYPKEVIKFAMTKGCDNGMECVRCINFICEWLKRISNLYSLF